MKRRRARKLKYARIYASFFSNFFFRLATGKTSRTKKPESEESRYENIKSVKLY